MSSTMALPAISLKIIMLQRCHRHKTTGIKAQRSIPLRFRRTWCAQRRTRPQKFQGNSALDHQRRMLIHPTTISKSCKKAKAGLKTSNENNLHRKCNQQTRRQARPRKQAMQTTPEANQSNKPGRRSRLGSFSSCLKTTSSEEKPCVGARTSST